MLGLPTKSTKESAFEAFFTSKLARKRVFLGMLGQNHENFSNTLTGYSFQALHGASLQLRYLWA